MSYSGYPRIIFNIFKGYDWFGLYRDPKEAITPNIPEARGKEVYITMFVYDYLVGCKFTRRIQTSFLIFIDKDPIFFYRNNKASVEASTFEA